MPEKTKKYRKRCQRRKEKSGCDAGEDKGPGHDARKTKEIPTRCWRKQRRSRCNVKENKKANPRKYWKKAQASTGEVKMKDHIQASTKEYEVQENEFGRVPENGLN